MKHLLQSHLEKHWNKDLADKIQYSPVPREKEGDLALNFFALTKELKQAPPVIAQEIAEALEGCDLVQETNVAGPYLNVTFSNEAFFTSVLESQTTGDSQKDQSIVLEFSGPNTNKPLHLGHMRNHALGISTSNLFEAVGANMHRVNIINDRGIHICKSMVAYKKYGNNETPETTGEKSDTFVGRYYIKYNEVLKDDPSIELEAKQMLIDWEQSNPEVMDIWKKMNEWTLAGHQETYKRQGIAFEKSYYESDTYLMGKELAYEGVQKGVFQQQEDEKIVIDLEDEGLGEKVILRSDGTSIYLTQDLAVAKLRSQDFSPDLMIYTVADEQNYHFKVLFHCLEKLNILPVEKLHHLSYGLVNLPDGRMKSREGTVVDADNLMDELSGIAYDQIKSRNPEMSDEQAHTIAEQIMNAAWKFYILSTSPKKTITFDAKKSIDFQGSTGPYIQYAGVRIRSLFEKAGLTPPLAGEAGRGVYKSLSENEKPLGVKILEYPGVLEKAAKNLNTTYIVTYLLELAQEWSRYYAHTSIIKADTEAQKLARLALAQKVYANLEAGLHILGIEIPEKM